MKEQLLNNIYGYLTHEYNGLHENVDTDGERIWVDIKGKTYSVTVVECVPERKEQS